MTPTYRTHVVPAGQVVFEQIDVFQSDQFTRVTGLGVSSVTSSLRYNNQLSSWSLVSGVGVTDSQITSGSVYWNEVSPGVYGIRFFPNALGLWVLNLAYTPSLQQITVEFDVVVETDLPSINVSF